MQRNLRIFRLVANQFQRDYGQKPQSKQGNASTYIWFQKSGRDWTLVFPVFVDYSKRRYIKHMQSRKDFFTEAVLLTSSKGRLLGM